MGLSFEWDKEKAALNVAKHAVSFDEAMTVFSDLLATTIYDPDHSDDEDRYLSLGMSSEGRLLVVSFTDREDRIRIISARVANRRERKQYEEDA